MILRRHRAARVARQADHAAQADPEATPYDDLDKNALVDEAEARGLAKRGSKADIVARLLEHDAASALPDNPEDAGDESTTTDPEDVGQGEANDADPADPEGDDGGNPPAEGDDADEAPAEGDAADATEGDDAEPEGDTE